MTIAPARTAAASAAAAAMLLFSACGSLPEVGDLLPRNNEFLEQSPRAIVKTSFAEMRDVKSLRILGNVNVDDFTRVDLRLGDTDCMMSFDGDDGAAQLIMNSEGGWMKADDDFWSARSSSPREAALSVKAYSGAWIAIEETNELAELCDIDEFLGGFKVNTGENTKGNGRVDAEEVEKVGDVDAVPLTGRAGKKRTTMWIALDSPHYVVKMTQTQRGKAPVEIFFEEFGVEVVVETPRKSDIVVLPRG